MPYSAAQAAAVQSTVDAVRGNVAGHSQDFFIFYMKKYPDDMNKFPKYKGKSADSLRSVPSFAGHVSAVLEEALRLFEDAHDSSALHGRGSAQVASHVPRQVSGKEFQNMLTALTAFLQQTLGGSFDAGAWGAASDLVLAALK